MPGFLFSILGNTNLCSWLSKQIPSIHQLTDSILVAAMPTVFQRNSQIPRFSWTINSQIPTKATPLLNESFSQLEDQGLTGHA